MDRGLDFTGDLSPEVAGVPQLHAALVHEQVGRTLRLPLYYYGVVAGALELGAPEAAGLGLAEGPGERRPGSHAVPPSAGDGRSGQDARGEDQSVVRGKRVDVRRHLA